MKWVVAAGFLLLGGCGTILHTKNDTLFVDSNPSGADAYVICVGGSDRAITPAKLHIPRKAYDCHLHVERAGYKSQRIALERGYSNAYWANIFTVGIGFLVDYFSGAEYDFEPEELVVELERTGS